MYLLSLRALSFLAGYLLFIILVSYRVYKGELERGQCPGSAESRSLIKTLSQWANWTFYGDANRTFCSTQHQMLIEGKKPKFNTLLNWIFSEGHTEAAYNKHLSLKG